MVGAPLKKEFLYKKCVFILTCLNFSHLQSTPHWMQNTYQDIFSTDQNRFWTHWCWCLLVLLQFSVSPLPHGQNVSLWRLFSSRETKKFCSGRGQVNGWNGRGEHEGHAIFGQKLLNTQRDVGRSAHKSSNMKWANVLKQLSEKFHWGCTQPLIIISASTLIPMGS